MLVKSAAADAPDARQPSGFVSTAVADAGDPSKRAAADAHDAREFRIGRQLMLVMLASFGVVAEYAAADADDEGLWLSVQWLILMILATWDCA